MAEVAMAWRYVGGGAFLPGVPARDLTTAEAAQYGAQLASASRSGQNLYVPWSDLAGVAPSAGSAAEGEVASEPVAVKRRGKATATIEAAGDAAVEE